MSVCRRTVKKTVWTVYAKDDNKLFSAEQDEEWVSAKLVS